MAVEGEIGVFTPEQARMLWQDYQTRRQLQPKVSQNFPQRREVLDVSPHRVFVKNTTDEVIPAYACLQITGVDLVAERTVITVEKPTTTDGEYLFNSQYDIAVESATESGVGWAYRYGVVVMLGDEPSEAGETFQPIVDSWEIEEETAGPFVVFGRHEASDRALIGRFAHTSTGGGGLTIRFRITASYNCGQCYVSARVISVPYGVAVGSLPGVDVYDNYAVDVYDRSGCWFNEPPEDLLNRIGHAVYMTPLEDGPCPDTIFDSWEVISLCDGEATCGT